MQFTFGPTITWVGAFPCISMQFAPPALFVGVRDLCGQRAILQKMLGQWCACQLVHAAIGPRGVVASRCRCSHPRAAPGIIAIARNGNFAFSRCTGEVDRPRRIATPRPPQSFTTYRSAPACGPLGVTCKIGILRYPSRPLAGPAIGSPGLHFLPKMRIRLGRSLNKSYPDGNFTFRHQVTLDCTW